MPRIRTIKPDAFTSDTLSTVPRGTRWTFAGLWTYADDAGRGRDDVRLVKAALYPVDDDTTLEDVETDLRLLVQIGGLCRYVAGGRRYLHMPKWGHQKINRPSESKLPPCPLHDEGMQPPDTLTDEYVSDHGALTESAPPNADQEGQIGTHGALSEGSLAEKEQGTGKGTGNTDAAAPELFDEFWTRYPRKVARGAAVKAWKAAAKKVSDPWEIINACRSWSVRVQGSDEKFIPHASTWLNAERWLDETPAAIAAEQPRLNEPFRPPECPPEIAEDGTRYVAWLQGEKAKWDARQAATR